MPPWLRWLKLQMSYDQFPVLFIIHSKKLYFQEKSGVSRRNGDALIGAVCTEKNLTCPCVPVHLFTGD